MTQDKKLKNTWDIIHIINVHMHNIQMHMGIKFEISNTNILGVVGINVTKRTNMASNFINHSHLISA